MENATENIVLFDGSKSLWESHSNANVIIVHHTTHSCLEVIAYNPANGVESPRIYVSYRDILRKIQKLSSEELHDDIELHLRNHTGYNEKWLQHAIINNHIVDFILTRVALVTDSRDDDPQLLFEICLKILPNDKMKSEGDERIDVQCDKPDSLIPYSLDRMLHVS